MPSSSSAPRRIRSVALIGPDGAGKSTIAREVVRALGPRARYLYMGVNLESSGRMLPTTRLALAFKRTQGRGPRMTAEWGGGTGSTGLRRVVRGTYGAVRLAAWVAEEWYRAFVAAFYTWRGNFVVFDRHFLYDYWSSHVAGGASRPLAARVHGLLLRRMYPRPDFVVCLDAPADVLHARKLDQPVEWLEERRREYLALGSVAGDFAVVDTTQPRETVVAQIVALIEARRA